MTQRASEAILNYVEANISDIAEATGETHKRIECGLAVLRALLKDDSKKGA